VNVLLFVLHRVLVLLMCVCTVLYAAGLTRYFAGGDKFVHPRLGWLVSNEGQAVTAIAFTVLVIAGWVVACVTAPRIGGSE
jgi:hypothetical protein